VKLCVCGGLVLPPVCHVPCPPLLPFVSPAKFPYLPTCRPLPLPQHCIPHLLLLLLPLLNFPAPVLFVKRSFIGAHRTSPSVFSPPWHCYSPHERSTSGQVLCSTLCSEPTPHTDNKGGKDSACAGCQGLQGRGCALAGWWHIGAIGRPSGPECRVGCAAQHWSRLAFVVRSKLLGEEKGTTSGGRRYQGLIWVGNGMKLRRAAGVAGGSLLGAKGTKNKRKEARGASHGPRGRISGPASRRRRLVAWNYQRCAAAKAQHSRTARKE
jgi:hypothetical protein